jgi:hypothetical protein
MVHEMIDGTFRQTNLANDRQSILQVSTCVAA